MSDHMSKEELKAAILDAVNGQWKISHKPLMLSQIGVLEGGRLAASIKAHGFTLAKFIRVELSDQTRVVAHSKASARVGVVPLNDITETLEDFDGLFGVDAGSESMKANLARETRFHYAFWNAFRLPIADGQKRFVNPKGVPAVVNLSATSEVPEYFYEILLSDISADPTQTQQVVESVRIWCKRHGLDQEMFSISNMSKNHLDQRDGHTLLAQVLNALTESQKRGLSLSLDVVEALTRKSSK